MNLVPKENGFWLGETNALVAIWGGADVQSKLDEVARNRSVYQMIAAALADSWEMRLKTLLRCTGRLIYCHVMVTASSL